MNWWFSSWSYSFWEAGFRVGNTPNVTRSLLCSQVDFPYSIKKQMRVKDCQLWEALAVILLVLCSTAPALRPSGQKEILTLFALWGRASVKDLVLSARDWKPVFEVHFTSVSLRFASYVACNAMLVGLMLDLAAGAGVGAWVRLLYATLYTHPSNPLPAESSAGAIKQGRLRLRKVRCLLWWEKQANYHYSAFGNH